MKVYLPPSSRNGRPHTYFVAPAADIKGESPAEWLDETGKPRSITVEFRNGEADVPENLAHYLIKRGIARKTKLILPGD